MDTSVTRQAMTVTEVTKIRSRRLRCDTQTDGRDTQTPLPACKPHASPEEPAKTDLPLLPGGATILCHFWNSVVLRQSRGLSAYALWRDISSCIGSRMTHSCKETQRCISCFGFQCSSLKMEEGERSANGGGCIKAPTFYTSQLLILRQNNLLL
jgi:hypothetical protein